MYHDLVEAWYKSSKAKVVFMIKLIFMVEEDVNLGYVGRPCGQLVVSVEPAEVNFAPRL